MSFNETASKIPITIKTVTTTPTNQKNAPSGIVHINLQREIPNEKTNKIVKYFIDCIKINFVFLFM